MTIGVWSRFYHFEEVFEYHGVFDESGKSSRTPKMINGITGVPHSHNGFRLRSVKGGRLSYSKLPLKNSLDYLPCPLADGEIGCYLIRVNALGRQWDYIGKSRELAHGIWHRLLDHLIKIAGTEDANFNSSTSKFSQMHMDLRLELNIDPNSANFFNDHVKFAFVKVDRSSAEYREHVSKIEGMALAFYKEKLGDFPNLNTTNETKGLDGFSQLT